MNALQTFEFNTNQLRVETDENGNPWFCAKDVCAILGYTNHNKAIKDHCKSEGVTKMYPLQTAGGVQYPAFINEGNLYRLIIKSHKPESEPFEAWVCDEVLPAIRKTGSYTASPALPSRDYEILKNKYIALLEQENARLKALESPPAVRFGQHRGWTPAQDQELLELKAQGLGYTAIGAKVGRSRENCRYRYNALMNQKSGESL